MKALILPLALFGHIIFKVAFSGLFTSNSITTDEQAVRAQMLISNQASQVIESAQPFTVNRFQTVGAINSPESMDFDLHAILVFN